jgi:hypothetical protein
MRIVTVTGDDAADLIVVDAVARRSIGPMFRG